MVSKDRDLFGNIVPPKRRRGRPRSQASLSEDGQASALQLPLTTPPPPGLGDLVTRLKPLHHRIESDLAATLARDAALQAEVNRQCEAISQNLGVVVSAKQYLHTAATVTVLKALFLRVAEDYGLFPGPARKVALRGDLFSAMRDLAPRLTWADYLEYAVRDLAYLPVAYDLFKETGYELVPPGSEIARALLDAVGDLPDLRPMDTRALGDLYQHLMDPEERKRLAYYPTPDFIIDFLLDRTLEPAIREFGVYDLRYLDICSGTGHFGVRTYRRLDRHLAIADPTLTPLERFERIIENNLFAIDVSEFATRVTLFRLFLEGVRLALREGRDPAAWGADLTFNVYTANSLIKLPRQEAMPLFAESRPPLRERDPVAPWYRRELTHLRVDLHDALAKGFHVINANPPYVRIQKQGAQVVAPVNGSWEVVEFVNYLRENYQTASGNFDLSVPFAERGLELLVPGGYLGYITSSKFAKQTYGKKLTSLLAGGPYRLLLFADLTDAHVFDVGTFPSLILLQRTPEGIPVPADAPVEVLATYEPAAGGGEEDWAILRGLLARPGDAFEPYAGHYTERQDHFRAHPWTLRRGPGDLLARIKATSDKSLAEYGRIGIDFMSNADPVFCDYITDSFIRRHRLEREICLPCLRGENVRNWMATWHGNRKREQTYVLFTHDPHTDGLLADLAELYPNAFHYLLRYKEYLWARAAWERMTYKVAGNPFYQLHQTSAHLGVPKLIVPRIATHAHFFVDERGSWLAKDSCEVAYLSSGGRESTARSLALVLNSSVGNYFLKQAGHKKFDGATESKARYEWDEKHSGRFPVARALSEYEGQLDALSGRIQDVVGGLARLSPYHYLRHLSLADPRSQVQGLADQVRELLTGADDLRSLQSQADSLVCEIYLLGGEDLTELADPTFQRPWRAREAVEKGFWQDVEFETRDLLCDLIEDVFAAQRPPQEQPLTPSRIANVLAQNPKFEPLRAVYYGGQPISAEQFVRDCLDWDCRPIPFDPESVLVGRKPKRVDILHERFFRFDGVDRNLYGWTGWSAEAQANVFLTLAERAQDRLPFHRWVSRLIHLPEEAPDIADPSLRADLEALIGDVEPYPYVVMDKE